MPASPLIATAYKTAVFRIHNPSRHKRAMLRDALTRNHLAYTKLLVKLLPDVEQFSQIKKGKTREGAIAKIASQIIKPLPLSIGAKAGLVSDVAGQLSSHIELRSEQEAPSVPTAAPLNSTPADHRARLTDVAQAVALEQETAARDRLMAQAKAGQRRPILFLKNRMSDGFLILFCPKTGRYFAWFNLHAQNSRFARVAAVRYLVNVRTGEVMSFTSRTGALFPLAFGRDFQLDEFLAAAHPQSAKLVESEGGFELHVTFEFETPKIMPRTRLGVDRGIYNLASLCAIDDGGRIIERRNVDGRSLRYVQRFEERRQRTAQRRGRHYTSRARRHLADEAVHVAANEIVTLAKEHGAQVVVESLKQLTHRGKKRARSNFNRVLNRSQYQKLEHVLDYKLAVAGLPRPKEVSAAYTSQTCPRCGYQHRDNRPKIADGDGFKVDRFFCGRCGHEDDADLNAARVIAMKRMWRESLPPTQRSRPMSELAEQYGFEKFLRDRAAMRGDGPCDREVGTSGGRGLGEAGPTPAEQSEGNLTSAQTPWREQKSAATLPQLSSSNEIPPQPQEDHSAHSTDKDHIR